MSKNPDRDFTGDYLRAILRGDRPAASRLVIEARNAGASVMDLYEEVIGPAMQSLGDMWYRDEVTVAQEHVATAVTELILTRCYEWLLDDIDPEIYGSAVLACPGEELHQVGLRMFSDVLDAVGMDSYYCGPRTPAEEIPGIVGEVEARLLALSVSMPTHLPVLKATLQRVRQNDPRVLILVGGRAVGAGRRMLDELDVRVSSNIRDGLKIVREELSD